MTLEELKQGIEDYFGDTSRSEEETVDGLSELRDDIEMRLEALSSDD